MMPERLTPEHFTDDELKWSYWFVTHRILLLKLVFFFLVFVNVVLGGIFIWKMIDMYVLKGNAYTNGLNTLMTTTANIGNLQPQGEASISEIQILDSQALPSLDNRFDVFALLGNANTKYHANFEYRFVGAQDTTPWKKGFLLPNESRYVYELFFKSTGDMSGSVVEFRNLKWNKFLEYDKFASTHLRMNIQEPTFVPADGEQGGNKVTFKVTNESSYSYRKVGFFVALYLGTQIQAVNHIVLSNVGANESFDVEVPFYDVSNASTIEVLPEVDILNESIYQKL